MRKPIMVEFFSPGKFDMVAIAVGTGGTITGIGKKFKEKVPYVEVNNHPHHRHSEKLFSL